MAISSVAESSPSEAVAVDVGFPGVEASSERQVIRPRHFLLLYLDLLAVAVGVICFFPHHAN